MKDKRYSVFLILEPFTKNFTSTSALKWVKVKVLFHTVLKGLSFTATSAETSPSGSGLMISTNQYYYNVDIIYNNEITPNAAFIPYLNNGFIQEMFWNNTHWNLILCYSLFPKDTFCIVFSSAFWTQWHSDSGFQWETSNVTKDTSKLNSALSLHILKW